MYCVKCGNELSSTDRFCTSCGTAAGSGNASGHRRGQAEENPTDNYTARRFPIPGTRMEDLANRLSSFLTVEDYDVQVMPLNDGTLLIQASKKGGWRKFIGMKSASNILIEPGEDTSIVKIGSGKWLEKAATGVVGMLFFWPLAVTTGLGVYEQSQLPNKVFKVIEQFSAGY
jgi:hypothetical protein